ncbi:MAG: acyl-CoA synthetase [Deltaproteobacteria bacterium]|nr:acyl-CoA synthetase [Deltaproteobacteria bacterium]MBI3390863.1 acyl-CoA synthetase [Deltaproteobacteria bacterium]
MPGFNLAEINEAIAAAIPERECIVYRDRRISWQEFTTRTRQLGNFLRSRGLGCHQERATLQNFESGQDHLGIYLYNGNEYLEGMIGAYKARVAPFNVNYRYVEDELVYLLNDADCRALIYHARFAPTLQKIRGDLPHLEVLLQVADESGHGLLPGAVDYEDAVRESSPERPPVEWSSDDLYILYTGGTTGMPKGVLWRQEDIFFGALGGALPGGMKHESIGSIVEMAKASSMRALPAPPFMHGAAHWMAFTCFHQGGTVIVQNDPGHLDPHDIWSIIEREKIGFLTIVGDAFGRPLLDHLGKQTYDLSSLTILLSGGAILTPALKQEFLDKIPHLMIIDGFGASETGGQGSQITMKGMPASTGSFKMNEQTIVLTHDLSAQVAPGSDESGWLARSGHVPLGYFKDAEKTAKTFPVVNGARYAVPGDHAKIGADGAIVVLGRGSVSINSGGEKIYPEEVEKALKHHPSVYDAVVVGTPNPRFGQQVTAVVQARAGEVPGKEELTEFCANHVARYKLPKAIIYVDEMVRSPSGKADYRWAKKIAFEALGIKE